MRHAADRLSVRWYLGYDLGEPLPDHSSLTRIRTRYGVEVFRRFFEKIVEQCQQAELVWGKELSIDGTKVEANAGFPQAALCRRGTSDQSVSSGNRAISSADGAEPLSRSGNC